MSRVLKVPEILYEDKYLIVTNKPAGLVVQGAGSKRESFLELIKSYIKQRDKKPGNVFLGVVHRLDRPVSGALIFAKRSKTAKRLFESLQKKEVFKVYIAEVEGFLKGEGLWKDYLKWDERKRRAFVLNKPEIKTKEALTYYYTLKSSKESIVLLVPLTGRKHQLRAVLSKRGFPIRGDLKYGSKKKVIRKKAILLHSIYLKFPHPMTRNSIEVIASLPEYFSLIHLDKRLNLEFFNRILKRLKEGGYVSG